VAGKDTVSGCCEDSCVLPIPGQFNGEPTAGPVNDQDAGVRGRMHSTCTTSQLRDIILAVVAPPHQNKSLARVFQALRIVVNRELEQLSRVKRCGGGKGYLIETQSASFRPSGLRIRRAEVWTKGPRVPDVRQINENRKRSFRD
jgi:hypothetical protein